MRALISVSDKTGIVELAKALEKLGIELISTGGTYRVLSEHVKVTPVDKITGQPEILDGRVKTLHPKVHGGILAIRDNTEHQRQCAEYGITGIDIVVVNLYPFRETVADPNMTLEDAIEDIDIGGPAMIRAAAKNFKFVTVIVNPERYTEVIRELQQHNGQTTVETRQKLAEEAFTHTSSYDAAISSYLRHITHNRGNDSESKNPLPELPNDPILKLKKYLPLRYGENPHQNAALYQIGDMPTGLCALNQLHGKDLSYNNLIDIEAAWKLVHEFEQPAAIIIKHTNPCGAAIGSTLAEAYQKAYDADSVSAFGSIVGLNQPVTEEVAQAIHKTFVEVVVAPKFSPEAVAILTQKQAIRLIELAPYPKTGLEWRSVEGGMLAQEKDAKTIQQSDCHPACHPELVSGSLWQDLLFAFKIAKHVKSNAIVIAKNGQTVGIGAGQMSRIESVEIAIRKAGASIKGAVLASDGFFPFRDSVDRAAKEGIAAIIQPGGSKRDDDSIAAAQEHVIPVVLTGVRHFKH